MDKAHEIKTRLPKFVTDAANVLLEAGYEAYLVGGSVRDLLLDRTPQDYDIATNAYPEEVEKLFEKSIPTGAKFGTMLVLITDETGETRDIEVTTYRSEADYFGGRWPAKVEFTKTIDEDLARRDFTINAIALSLDPKASPGKLLIDPFMGMEDLESKVIKAVGNPVERFSEDGLRSLRACRLAANLGFRIEPKTFAAIGETLSIVDNLSQERVRDELMKLLLKSPKPSIGLELMRQCGLLQKILPEILEGVGVTQPEFHTNDVYTHSLKSVDLAEDSIKLAALLHDIGKPRTRTKDSRGTHFYGHDVRGAEMTREIMKRLKFSNAEIERTATLVRWHMFYYPNADWRKTQNAGTALTEMELESLRQEQLGEGTIAGGWSDAAVRRFIRNAGGEDVIDDLMKLRIADASANEKNPFNPEELQVLAERIADVRSKDMALKVTDLDVSGHDMMQIGAKGNEIGRALNYLLEEVTDDPLLNDKEKLLELARNYLAQNRR